MKNALQIVWRGLEASEALSQRIKHLAVEEEAIDSCRVVIELSHHHRHQDARYQVKVEAAADGQHYEATSEASDDAYAAINAAFASLKRQLAARGPKARAELRRARRKTG